MQSYNVLYVLSSAIDYLGVLTLIGRRQKRSEAKSGAVILQFDRRLVKFMRKLRSVDRACGNGALAPSQIESITPLLIVRQRAVTDAFTLTEFTSDQVRSFLSLRNFINSSYVLGFLCLHDKRARSTPASEIGVVISIGGSIGNSINISSSLQLVQLRC